MSVEFIGWSRGVAVCGWGRVLVRACYLFFAADFSAKSSAAYSQPYIIGCFFVSDTIDRIEGTSNYMRCP